MDATSNHMDDPAVPAESPHPVVGLVVPGHFDEGPSYTTWREQGTADWLLFHTLAGLGRVNGTQALPGTVLLLPPGTRHDYGTDRERWEFQFAHFHPQPAWLPLLTWPEAGAGVRRLGLTATVAERVREALGACIHLAASGLPHAQRLGVNALEAALLWCAQEAQSSLDPRIRAAVEHIGRALAAPASVAVLARVVGLSPSRFAHLFRVQVGTPVMQFVEQQRMAQAKLLLELTQRPVQQVARDVGYDDPLHFSTRFRRLVGSSPTTHRRATAGLKEPGP